jgi:hypothetical protein
MDLLRRSTLGFSSGVDAADFAHAIGVRMADDHSDDVIRRYLAEIALRIEVVSSR